MPKYLFRTVLIEQLICNSTLAKVEAGFKLIDSIQSQVENKVDLPILNNNEKLNVENYTNFKESFTPVNPSDTSSEP